MSETKKGIDELLHLYENGGQSHEFSLTDILRELVTIIKEDREKIKKIEADVSKLNSRTLPLQVFGHTS